jgi:SAM-dependent methyltransferase
MNVSPYQIEEKVQTFHWWFVVRRQLLKTVISSLNIPRESLTIDIGCGVGSNLSLLKAIGLRAIGCDRSLNNLQLAKTKFFLPFINGDLENLAIRSSSVELVIATDVLEHLADDIAGVRELYRILCHNGHLIVTVPAFQSLRGIQDIVTGHYRRYRRKEIVEKLSLAGFDILKSSYFNFFLFFPILMGRRLIRLFGLRIESENKINFPLLNSLLKAIFSLEPPILKYVSFPFGVSLLCIARKKG